MEMNGGTSMDEGSMNNSTIHNTGENIQSQDCCSVKVIDSKVNDNYISNISETVSHPQILTVILTPNISIDKLLNNSIQKNYFDTSPPLHQGNPLYLSNSILLI